MNIPNMLSATRLLFVPMFIFLYFTNKPLALILFIIACITDILDGYIARRFNMITKIGKILDPVADKLMQLSAAACLCFAYVNDVRLLPKWAFVLILAKELTMLAGTLVLYKRGIVVPANIIGKASTVVISICVIAMLFFGKTLIPYKDIIAIVISIGALSALMSYGINFAAVNNQASQK